MRHRAGAFLALAKEFFDFQNFGSLQVTKFGGPTLDAGADQGQRPDELSMQIPLNDLGRDWGRAQAKLFADSGFNLR